MKKSGNKRIANWILMLIIILFSVTEAQFVWADTPRVSIFYDGSGSMMGFFNTQSNGIVALNTTLYDVFSARHMPCESSVFITRGGKTETTSLEAFLEKPRWGSETRLDDAMTMAAESDIVVLVTDNVQDVGGAGESGIRNFYRQLEASPVQMVLLFPLSRRFEGPLYFYKNQYPDSDFLLNKLTEHNSGADFSALRTGDTYQVINMAGQRAMAIYVVFKISLPDNEAQKLINRMQKYIQVPPLTVKPIDQGKIFIKGTMDPRVIEKTFRSFASLCGESPEKAALILKKPNLELQATDNNIFRASSRQEGKVLTLSPADGLQAAYRVDERKTYRFYSCVANKSSTLVLGKSEEPCSDKISMQLKDVGFSIPSDYRSCFFKPEKEALMDTVPDYLPGAMFSEGDIEPGTCPFVALHTVEVPPFRLRLDWGEPMGSLKTIFRLSFIKYLPLTIKGSFQIIVPPGYFSVNPFYNETYFTTSAYDQGKIYAPEDIISYINDNPTVLTSEFLSKQVYLEVPGWIRFFVITGLMAFVGCLLILLFGSMRHVTLVFNDKKRKPLFINLPIPFSKGLYRADDRVILTVRKKWINYVAYPGEGYQLSHGETNAPMTRVTLPSKGAFVINGPGMDHVLVQPFADKGADHDIADRLERPDSRKGKKEPKKVDESIFDGK